MQQLYVHSAQLLWKPKLSCICLYSQLHSWGRRESGNHLSVHRRIHREIGHGAHSLVLLSFTKEGNSDACCNMDEPGRYGCMKYIRWKLINITRIVASTQMKHLE